MNFEGGVVFVEEQFEFTFDENTFIDPENSKIIYNAFIQNINLTSSSSEIWLKFLPNERKFIGKASKNLFY